MDKRDDGIYNHLPSDQSLGLSLLSHQLENGTCSWI